MRKAGVLIKVLIGMLAHPVGRQHKIATMVRFLRWQIGSRLLGMPVAIPFVAGSRILVQTGMHGETMNYYVGLREFGDMVFVRHLLRGGDTFVDVGAYVGDFTILAAAGKNRDVHVVAFEPVPSSYQQLLDNAALNRLGDFLQAKNMGISGTTGNLVFTTRFGPKNHVLSDGEHSENGVTIPVDKLDNLVGDCSPTMIKVDAEGFESEIISGANNILENETMLAILIEMNGLGKRYGHYDDDIHSRMLSHGFRPVRYHPSEREIEQLSHYGNSETGNTLYVRSLEKIKSRLQSAESFSIGEMNISI